PAGGKYRVSKTHNFLRHDHSRKLVCGCGSGPRVHLENRDPVAADDRDEAVVGRPGTTDAREVSTKVQETSQASREGEKDDDHEAAIPLINRAGPWRVIFPAPAQLLRHLNLRPFSAFEPRLLTASEPRPSSYRALPPVPSFNDFPLSLAKSPSSDLRLSKSFTGAVTHQHRRPEARTP